METSDLQKGSLEQKSPAPDAVLPPPETAPAPEPEDPHWKALTRPEQKGIIRP